MNKLEQIEKDVAYCESELKGKGFSGVHILIDDINALLPVVEAAIQLTKDDDADQITELARMIVLQNKVEQLLQASPETDGAK